MPADPADKMTDCTHTCCPRKKQYKDGKSSSWREHVRKQTERVHHLCTEKCPGWDKLPEKTRKAHRSSPIRANEVLERDQVFSLLWILDPTSREKSAEEVDLRSEWTEVTLRPSDAAMLNDERLNGYIFPPGEDGEAWICDYLDLYRRLPTESYDKDIMLFTEFQKIVLEGNSTRLGGFDVVVLPFIAVDLWEKEIYNFVNDNDVQRYLDNLESFEEDDVHFWPSFAECLAHADKLKQAHRLDAIASEVTMSPRPVTRPTTIRDAKNATEVILKRSFSDKSSHVYVLPREKAKVTADICKPNAGLLLQTYIPTLISYGELRVAVSYGRVIWRVWTKRDKEGNVEFVDVNHVGKILNVPMKDLPEDPFDNNYFQTSFDLEGNLHDIDEFAITTAEALIKKETMDFGYEPSLSAFARLDIGIMKDTDGKAKFFVNEVERLPAVTLWRGAHHVGPVAAAFDHGLYKATKSRCV